MYFRMIVGGEEEERETVRERYIIVLYDPTELHMPDRCPWSHLYQVGVEQPATIWQTRRWWEYGVGGQCVECVE